MKRIAKMARFLQPVVNSKVPFLGEQFKSFQAGEDAAFWTSNAFGVADGVGSWRGVPGANSARMSRLLMHFCAEYAESLPLEQFVSKACESATLEMGAVKGTCTLSVCAIVENELHCLNLGDSVLVVIRDGGISIQLEESMVDFNLPRQFGTANALADYRIQKHELKRGDVVVHATDGLWDNCFVEEILSCHCPDLDKFAECLGSQCVGNSLDAHYESPFQAKAMEAGFYFAGGNRMTRAS